MEPLWNLVTACNMFALRYPALGVTVKVDEVRMLSVMFPDRVMLICWRSHGLVFGEVA